MGTYLNPGKSAFEEAINSEIFVDKTEMIQYLNSVVRTKQKYVSVSHPRRFGKTMAADMVCAYYDREAESRELFSKRKLAACAPVKTVEKEICWEEKSDRVAELLEEAHNQAGNKTYNDEAALSYAVQLAYFTAQRYYTTILELDSGKGYIDIAYLPAPKYPDIPAMIVELKYDKTVETAMDRTLLPDTVNQ